jgi:hypothetical protein
MDQSTKTQISTIHDMTSLFGKIMRTKATGLMRGSTSPIIKGRRTQRKKRVEERCNTPCPDEIWDVSSI